MKLHANRKGEENMQTIHTFKGIEILYQEHSS